LYATLRDRAVIGERWIAGFGVTVVEVIAGFGVTVVEVVGSAAAPPVVAAAERGRCRDGRDDQAGYDTAEGTRPQDNNLFRRPPGLADGLALKEPALPMGPPWDSPQQLGSPGL